MNHLETLQALADGLNTLHAGTVARFGRATSPIPESFGAVGDGTTDDTAALQAWLNHGFTNNVALTLPAKPYKTTAPLVLTYGSGANNRSGVSIIGVGGSTMGITSRSPASRILAYNIPAGRAALELWGSDNGNFPSPTLENFAILCDYTTCDSLSWCLGIGDSWFARGVKLKLSGFNCMLMRNGTTQGVTGYATIANRFEQCLFETFRYYDFTGAATGTKAIYGWAVAPERLFKDNTSMSAFAGDSITFADCWFSGSVMSYNTSAVFQSCLWHIPGVTRPTVATSGVASINRVFYDTGDGSSVLDTSIGLYVAAGNVTLINPYFEDVMRCIYVRGQNSRQVPSLSITNPTFIGQANIPGAGSGVFVPEYVLKSHTTAGSMARLDLRGGTMAAGNAGQFSNPVVNNGWRNLYIHGLYGLVAAGVTDTIAINKQIVYS